MKLLLLNIHFFLLALLFYNDVNSDEIGTKTLQPVHIKSDEMEINRKEHKIIFTGRVTAQQGDIQIYADRLVADYSENGKEILSITATGSAKVVDKNRVALCGEIFMDNKNRTIIMKDNPKLWEGEDLLEGEEIIYFIDEERFKIKKARASIRSRTVER